MGMIRGIENLSRCLLFASLNVLYPIVTQDFIKASSLFYADSEHAANDISAFPRQNTEQTPRALDDFLTVSG